MRLPNEFYLECRYSAYMSDTTRGVLGWSWKDPLNAKISLVNDQGAQVFGRMDDRLRERHHAAESTWVVVVVRQEILSHDQAARREDGRTVATFNRPACCGSNATTKSSKVFFDGQSAAVGTMNVVGQLAGFEIDVVKAKNGTLSFTDFKVGR